MQAEIKLKTGAMRWDRLDPETEEITNEALYDILGPDFFDEEPKVAIAV